MVGISWGSEEEDEEEEVLAIRGRDGRHRRRSRARIGGGALPLRCSTVCLGKQEAREVPKNRSWATGRCWSAVGSS
ncbi:hypothetical protein BDA96_03G346700 [Sorghum bicolor]|uniref:Uncharacterized protein n=1 Tax=Sorghum bicolor TaxID=4558 RepID=A0A921RGN7_SORBI|nr:hypothetical protein BDA96_03G346700 [Sorghum bicolor]